MTHEAVHDAVTQDTSDDRLTVVARPPLQRRPGPLAPAAGHELVDLTAVDETPALVVDLTALARTAEPAADAEGTPPASPAEPTDPASARTATPTTGNVRPGEDTATQDTQSDDDLADETAGDLADDLPDEISHAVAGGIAGDLVDDLVDAVEGDAEAPADVTDADVAGARGGRGAWRGERPAGADPRFAILAAMGCDDPERGRLRRTLIEAHLPLVHHLAQRFRGRGEPYDDLVQVGTIGLLHAVDRFDPQRGGSFTAFAVPTILGEIRRHFRDRGWAMRVPRRLQDLGRRVSEAREALTHRLDRSPTAQEIATYLDADLDLVLEALETASAYSTVPLPTTPDEAERYQQPWTDSGLELVEQRETLRPLLARLPVREQRILDLRFGRGLSQSQIAAEVGVSQMHVSRLLAKSLATLRTALVDHD